MDENFWRLFAWSVDLCRKLDEFSLLRKLLIRIVLGKHAFRELVGVRDELIRQGYSVSLGYGLEGCDYHKDKVSWK